MPWAESLVQSSLGLTEETVVARQTLAQQLDIKFFKMLPTLLLELTS